MDRFQLAEAAAFAEIVARDPQIEATAESQVARFRRVPNSSGVVPDIGE